MWKLIVSFLINAVSIWAAAQIVGGIYLASDLVTILVVTLIFGVVNTIIRPILSLVTCPFYILTLGLFTFIVNALMLMLTAYIAGPSFEVQGFIPALLGSILISLVSAVLSAIFVQTDKSEEDD